LKFVIRLTNAARIFPYFDVVERLAWSNDPESYVGGSVATGRSAHASQVKGDDPGKKRQPGLPCGGGGGRVRLTAPCHKKQTLIQP